jgi:hypothetical protein
MDKLAYKYPIKITPELRYWHIMEIVQEAYNDFRRAQIGGETVGTNGKLQLKMTSITGERCQKKCVNPVKQSLKRKRPIQNSLEEFLWE